MQEELSPVCDCTTCISSGRWERWKEKRFSSGQRKAKGWWFGACIIKCYQDTGHTGTQYLHSGSNQIAGTEIQEAVRHNSTPVQNTPLAFVVLCNVGEILEERLGVVVFLLLLFFSKRHYVALDTSVLSQSNKTEWSTLSILQNLNVHPWFFFSHRVSKYDNVV